MKTQKYLFFSALFFLIIMSSCLTEIFIMGNGEVVEEIRSVDEFSGLSSMGSFNVYFEYSPTTEVTIKAESNLIPYIETYVIGSMLKITTSFDTNLHPTKSMDVYVKGPYVDEIHLSGSGIISTDTIYSESFSIKVSGSGDIETYFVGDEFESKISGSGKMDVYTECITSDIEVSGSGRIEIAGEASHSAYRISGSGRVKAYDFEVETATANISGSGDLYLNVSEELTGYIAGSGNLYYIGHPEIDINIAGSGRVINQNSHY